ncbi:MAG: hypothetical protein F6K24_30105, partial [Okeania sp. SIO2D1]|nr:hypothetical protein [Okeania sp. SIO2D1]
KNITPPKEVKFKGITPEMKTVYDLVARQKEEFLKQMQQQRDEKQLREALEMGGGELHNFCDRSTYWQVEWVTRDGERHTSAIDKNDLTVVSAGIFLSGGDRHFDLQSLVGVVKEGRRKREEGRREEGKKGRREEGKKRRREEGKKRRREEGRKEERPNQEKGRRKERLKLQGSRKKEGRKRKEERGKLCF